MSDPSLHAYNSVNNLRLCEIDKVLSVFLNALSVFFLSCFLRDRKVFPVVTLQLAPEPPNPRSCSDHLCQVPKNNISPNLPHTPSPCFFSFRFCLGLIEGLSNMWLCGNVPSNCSQVADFSTSKAVSHNATLAEVMFSQWRTTGWHIVTTCHRRGLPHPGPCLLECVNKVREWHRERERESLTYFSHISAATQ